MRRPGLSRRTLLQAALPAHALGPLAARADAPVPIADMHSHYGMIQRTSLPRAANGPRASAGRAAFSSVRRFRPGCGIVQAGETSIASATDARRAVSESAREVSTIGSRAPRTTPAHSPPPM